MSITVTSKEDKLIIDKKLNDLTNKGKFDSTKHLFLRFYSSVSKKLSNLSTISSGVGK